MEFAPFDKPGEHHAMLASHFLESAGIVVLEIGVAGKNKFAALHVHLRTSLNEVMQIFLGDETTHSEHILPRLDAELGEIFGIVAHIGCRNAIVD